MTGDRHDLDLAKSGGTGHEGFELKKAVVLQHFNLKAAQYFAEAISAPPNPAVWRSTIESIVLDALRMARPSFKRRSARIMEEQDAETGELWEDRGKDRRVPPRDSIRYEQNPSLLIMEQTELANCLRQAAEEVVRKLELVCNAPAAGDSSNPRSPYPELKEWKDLKIIFLSEHRVQLMIAGKRGPSLSYSELGFGDGRRSKDGGDKPITAWTILLELSAAHGSPIRFRREQVHEIRKRFKEHFGLESDPFIYSKRGGFTTRFSAERGPSFHR